MNAIKALPRTAIIRNLNALLIKNVIIVKLTKLLGVSSIDNKWRPAKPEAQANREHNKKNKATGAQNTAHPLILWGGLRWAGKQRYDQSDRATGQYGYRVIFMTYFYNFWEW